MDGITPYTPKSSTWLGTAASFLGKAIVSLTLAVRERIVTNKMVATAVKVNDYLDQANRADMRTYRSTYEHIVGRCTRLLRSFDVMHYVDHLSREIDPGVVILKSQIPLREKVYPDPTLAFEEVKKIAEQNQVNKVLIPFVYPGQGWLSYDHIVLIAVDLQNKQILYYDSQGASSNSRTTPFKDYPNFNMAEQLRELGTTLKANVEESKQVQRDFFNCGVYVLNMINGIAAKPKSPLFQVKDEGKGKDVKIMRWELGQKFLALAEKRSSRLEPQIVQKFPSMSCHEIADELNVNVDFVKTTLLKQFHTLTASNKERLLDEFNVLGRFSRGESVADIAKNLSIDETLLKNYMLNRMKEINANPHYEEGVALFFLKQAYLKSQNAEPLIIDEEVDWDLNTGDFSANLELVPALDEPSANGSSTSGSFPKS